MRHSFRQITTAGNRLHARRRFREWHGNACNPYSPILSIGLLLIVAVFAFVAAPA